MDVTGIKSVWNGFTGRVKAGNSNRKGTVPRSMGTKEKFNPVFDEVLAEVLEDIIELERRIKNRECEVVRIGNIIRRRRIKREVTN